LNDESFGRISRFDPAPVAVATASTMPTIYSTVLNTSNNQFTVSGLNWRALKTRVLAALNYYLPNEAAQGGGRLASA
jgi:hypothetical protein